MSCTLIHGDCLVEMDKLIRGGQKVDLVLTDPPYGTTNCSWDEVIPFDKMWDYLHQITHERSPILLFSNDLFGLQLKLSNLNDYKYCWVWDKVFSTNYMIASKRPLIPLEYINVFYRKQPTYNPQRRKKTVKIDRTRTSEASKKKTVYDKDSTFGATWCNHYYVDDGFRYPTNYIVYNSQLNECNNSRRFHPNQKPLPLLEYFIKTYTNEGDTVLDFTMGSGSTGVACLQTNRNFIGIELDEKYYNIAKERCSEYQSKLW